MVYDYEIGEDSTYTIVVHIDCEDLQFIDPQSIIISTSTVDMSNDYYNLFYQM